jgi:hypothetical protein
VSARSFDTFRADLIAGLTVAVVALPLAMALAIASGTAPERGLFTAVIAVPSRTRRSAPSKSAEQGRLEAAVPRDAAIAGH